MLELKHGLKPQKTADEIARQRFVSGMRGLILNDLAGDMRAAYERRAAPAFQAKTGKAPADGEDVHAALRGDPAFNIYSTMRVQAQKMVWSSVAGTVSRETAKLQAAADTAPDVGGTLTLNPDLDIPRNVSAIDVHLMPGSYTRGGDQLEAGAVYDQGLAVFSMGLMGDNLDDIGLSMAAYIQRAYPGFKPTSILDMGCTIGHNTLPWKQAFPDADVHAIDAAPGVLAYGHARARLQGQAVHFKQMAADLLDYPDDSFDMVFSSMFLHELSKKARADVFAQAQRVLKPGGLMLHMELPPNDQLSPFDGFYLDWDGHYNMEPFYKGFRDDVPAQLCANAGFPDDSYFQFVVPSIGTYGMAAVDALFEGDGPQSVDQDKVGRLAEGIMWFGFGAWKAA